MESLQLIREFAFARHALVVAVAVGTICSLISVVVVLKRMAFAGQGISHAGFGAIGTAVLVGWTGLAADTLVMVWCLLVALLIGWMARGRRMEPDSAIGILLVAAMAWGVLADDLSQVLRDYEWYRQWVGPPESRPGFESLLFGSLTGVTLTDAWLATGLGLAVLAICTAFFKEIVFFTFDEPVSRVFGVPTGLVHYLLMSILAVVIVVSIQLAGVVLVTALLVLPGATALQMSRRLGRVLFLAWAVGMIGTVGGLLVSLELGDFSTGPCIVGVLCILFAGVYGGRWLTLRRAVASDGA
ncbi:MAG: metal ABC transporter permease [Phycisphaeraceae bacterium]|nr:metal ABC transporter permease [Phycisphaeraceae bacterium]